MYPKWYAPATEQFCPRLIHAGFPLSDADDSDFDPPSDRPIVFTAGTAHHHCADFFQSAVAACQSLQRPGLLMSSYPQNFPGNLPPLVHTAAYVPFGQLLPHCSAIVHHGGIGTTSQALAAGTPQVVRPLAFDQFDNATRVERLGCGAWLRGDAQLAKTLGQILESNSIRGRCQTIAARLTDTAAPATAAQIIHSTLVGATIGRNRNT
jgi:UDP:flavonoid glycosyltransferase YjiC (YdhE family)